MSAGIRGAGRVTAYPSITDWLNTHKGEPVGGTTLKSAKLATSPLSGPAQKIPRLGNKRRPDDVHVMLG